MGAWLAWLSGLGVVPQNEKSGQLLFRSGHMPGLQVRSPVGVHREGSQLMFLSHIDVSFPLFLPSLPLSLKSQIKMKLKKR